MVVLELKEMRIGRWSELSAVRVDQETLFAMELEAEVMSGAVGS